MTAQALSPAEAAEFDQLARAPEKVEIHGRNRAWTHSVLAAVISAASISLGAAPAARAEAPPAVPKTARAAAPSGLLPTNQREAWALMRSTRAELVAQTLSPNMRVDLNVMAFPSGATQDLPQRARDFVYGRAAANLVNKNAGSDMPDVAGMRMGGDEGRLLVYKAVLAGMENAESPVATTYLSERGPEAASCVITISDAHLPALQEMSSATGLSLRQTRDLMVLHEAAHCAQNAEKLAALLEWSEKGEVSQMRYDGGMLGYRMESDLRAAALVSDPAAARQATERLQQPDYLQQHASTLSNERYAAGYATAAMLVSGGLKQSEVPRLAAFLQQQHADHRSGDFVQRVADELKVYPQVRTLKATPPEGGVSDSSFSARDLSRWLLPRWRLYEQSQQPQPQRETARARESAALSPATAQSRSGQSTWVDDGQRPTMARCGALARLLDRANHPADRPDGPKN